MPMLYRPLSSSSNFTEIRLLTVLPAKDITDPVRCHLTVTDRSGCSAYEALSYCWGDTSSKCDIEINGQPVDVTQNLLCALQHLRTSDSSRILWVDAICINQDDDVEKSRQVLLMRDIFKSASQVIVWLGPTATDSSLGFEALKRCLAWYPELERSFSSDALGTIRFGLLERFLRRLGVSPVLQPDVKKQYASCYQLHQPELAAIRGLLEREYWTRLWVVQEVCVASQIVVVCGHLTMIGDEFTNACKVALGPGGLLQELGAPLWLSCVVGLAKLRGLFRDEASAANSTQAPSTESIAEIGNDHAANSDASLQRILDIGSSFSCTDPHDKVYGLLGLATAPSIIPDYNLPLATCYQNITTSLITNMENLDVFTRFDAHYNLRTTAELPSWVVDLNLDLSSWEHHSWGPASPFKYHLALASLASIILDKMKVTEREPEFNASGSSTTVLPKVIEDSILVLEGHTNDHIAVLGSQLDGRLDGDNEESWRFFSEENRAHSLHNRCRLFIQQCLRTSCWVDVLMQWEDIAMKDPMMSRQQNTEAFCRLLQMAHPSADLTIQVGLYEEAWGSLISWLRILRPLKLFGAGRGLNPYHLVAGLISYFSTTRSESKTHLVLFVDRVLRGFKVARTAKGRLALVSMRTQHDDKVILLSGGKTPFIARAKNGRWEFIGPCYVDGIMLGEDWRQDHQQNFEFL
ncbi:hypothetical protein JX265_010004 [Neoarthrinium moseri]|uniref:Heterokaryon incompatibility domain-containing protein n=1 Tax=Neoarthrinium moseri TaxID=1658444 RepID=A0A9Q0AIP3_9PEZI|nr:hypothetical protein JX265_010004 [Neoarthrinium moseri]